MAPHSFEPAPPQPAEPQPASSGAVDEWTDSAIDGAEKWGAPGATPVILFAAIKRRNARIAELEEENAELKRREAPEKAWERAIAHERPNFIGFYPKYQPPQEQNP